MKNNHRLVVIVLAWKRIEGIKNTIIQLANQSYKNFDIHISNGNEEKDAIAQIENIVDLQRNLNKSNIFLSHDGNQYSCFRRFKIARDYARSGYTTVMFLDDDIKIPNTYVETFINEYEPNTYHSAYTWRFYDGGRDYWHRARIEDNKSTIFYGGAGVSMIDSKIFLDEGLMTPPEEAYSIDDLWISYYSSHVLGWKIKNVKIDGLIIGGGDQFALYKQIESSKNTKNDFLQKLIGMGWKV